MLDALLKLYPAADSPIATPVSLGNAGGGSGARLWRFETGIGPHVARAWPIDGPGPDALVAIHRQLARLSPLDFIPIPRPTRDGRTLVVLDGRAWEIAPWLPGDPDRSEPPAVPRVRAGFAGLAAVHDRLGVEGSVGPSPGLHARLDEIRSLLSGGLTSIEAAIGIAHDVPGIDMAARWTTAARAGLPDLLTRLTREAATPVPIQPVLRDARGVHFLFVADRLTGVVDFGAMGRDTPAADLARLLGDCVGRDPVTRRVAIEAYSSIRPLSPVESRMIAVFEEANAWLGPLRWIRWGFVDRRPFDDPDAVRSGLARTTGRLAAWLTSAR